MDFRSPAYAIPPPRASALQVYATRIKLTEVTLRMRTLRGAFPYYSCTVKRTGWM